MIETREVLTQRELMEYAQHKEMFNLEAEHRLAEKDKEIALATLEAKWSALLKLPITIIKLPLYLLFGLAICLAVLRKTELPESFWRLLK